jgi:hypothetical protein
MPRRIDNDGDSGRRVVVALIALCLVAGGVLIGRTLGTSPRPSAATAVTTTETAAPAGAQAVFADTRAGAASAAASYVAALGGPALLDPTRLRAIVRRVVAPSVLPELERAYAEAATSAQIRLGLNGQPKPIVILRSAPVGYRIERFSPNRAVVAVWDVGVVGSGANIDPQASWRTEHVTLIWDGGIWKAAEFRSASGPTPPLAEGDPETPPADLFASVPALRTYGDVRP